MNSKSSCFIPDTTAPTISSSAPANLATIQQGPDIKAIIFSEPVNNADKIANYKFSGFGGANLAVSAVTKVDDKTYMLTISGGLQNGPVTLTLSNITDWAGNALSTTTLTFTGSVNLAVTITPSGLPGSKYYVSNTFGTLNLNFTWQADSAAEQYFVNIVPFASPCPTAPTSSNSTGIGNTGVVAAANTNITTQIKASDMGGAGDYNICIFVNKTSLPLKSGGGSVVFTRDDVRPVFSSVTPASSSSTNNTNTGYTLSEDCASGSITRTRTAGSADPGSPYTQTLSVATELTTGAHASITNNPALVTGAVYSIAFNCSDYSGNPALTVTQTNVTYDTVAPVFSALAPATSAFVTLTKVSYTLSKAIASGSVTFTQTGGAADPGSPRVQALVGAEMNTGAHTNITLTNNPALVDGAVYQVDFNGTDAAGNVAATATTTGVTYDISAPSAPGAPTTTLISTTQVNVNGSATDNVGTVSYDVCKTTTSGACSTFTATLTAVSLPAAMSGLTANTTYYFAIRGRDQAGNIGAASVETSATTKNTTAGRVYGQLGSFTTNTANNGGVTANSLNTPQGIAVDASGVYIVDWGNNRVLYYSGTSTTATRVYGQAGSFTTNSNNFGFTTANTLRGPSGVAVDASGVYISDSNSRVLFYSGVSTTATRIYGHTSYTCEINNDNGSCVTATPTSTNLYYPAGVTVDASGVYVSDGNNARVLFYSGTATTASRVYGQLGSMTTNITDNGGITANSLYYPAGIGLDAGGVYVVDPTNSRVLYYAGTSTTASRVYQETGSFTSNAIGISRTGFQGPNGVTATAAGVFVADYSNNRVLYFPGTSTTASAVYGQAGNFTTNPQNWLGISATSLYNPAAVAVDASGGVYIVDRSNHRVLYFP